jgi:hypothetical protein
MARSHIISTPAAIRAIRDTLSKAFGYPAPGRNAATGEIVDPARKTGHGWTTEYESVREHPTDKRLHAVAFSDETKAALESDDVKARLDAAELADLRAKAAAAAELPADWEPVEVEAIERP